MRFCYQTIFGGRARRSELFGGMGWMGRAFGALDGACDRSLELGFRGRTGWRLGDVG